MMGIFKRENQAQPQVGFPHEVGGPQLEADFIVDPYTGQLQRISSPTYTQPALPPIYAGQAPGACCAHQSQPAHHETPPADQALQPVEERKRLPRLRRLPGTLALISVVAGAGYWGGGQMYEGLNGVFPTPKMLAEDVGTAIDFIK